MRGDDASMDALRPLSVPLAALRRTASGMGCSVLVLRRSLAGKPYRSLDAQLEADVRIAAPPSRFWAAMNVRQTALVAQDGKWWDSDLWLVSFRAMSETLTTLEIGARLELAPDTKHDIGDEIPDEDDTFVFSRAVWTLGSTVPFTEDLPVHLLALLELLEPRADAITSLLNEGCVIDFYASLTSGTGTGGTNLDSAVLGRVATLGASLDLSLSDEPGE